MTDAGRRGAARSRLPRLDAASLWTMLLAGAVATAAFDLFGQSLSTTVAHLGAM